MFILVSDRVDFRAKKITTDRDVCYTMICINILRRLYNFECMYPQIELQNM